jgi:hypothetical protein
VPALSLHMSVSHHTPMDLAEAADHPPPPVSHSLRLQSARDIAAISQLMQVQPQALLVGMGQVQVYLQGDCTAVSAMRVLRILLDRLGHNSKEVSEHSGWSVGLCCVAAVGGLRPKWILDLEGDTLFEGGACTVGGTGGCVSITVTAVYAVAIDTTQNKVCCSYHSFGAAPCLCSAKMSVRALPAAAAACCRTLPAHATWLARP